MPEKYETPQDLAKLIDEAASLPTRFDSIEYIHKYAPLPDDTTETAEAGSTNTHQLATAWAFAYRIKTESSEGKWRIVVEPYFRDASGNTVPPSVDQVPAEVAQAWSDLSVLIKEPFGLARLHHLLFERKHGNPRDHALAAASNYLATAQTWNVGLDRARYMNIALRLYRAVGAKNDAESIMDLMLADTKAAIAGTEYMPGVALQILKPLSVEPSAPEELGAVLENAYQKYADPFIKDEIVRIQLRRSTDNETRDKLEARLVQIWTDAAASSHGLLRALHLKKALERANEGHQRDLIERAAAELQKVRNEDLGLASFSASIQVDEQKITSLLSPMVEATDWQEALSLFPHAYQPATGMVAENRRNSEEQARQFVFASLFVSEQLGADGLPRFSPTSEDDKVEMRLAEQETFRLQAMAPFLAMALSKIAEVHGIPGEAELTRFFTRTPLADYELAGALARALLRYWMGDAEGAAFTITPRIEALARGLVLAVDIGIYRLQRSGKPGQYPALNFLLDVLRERGLDESWYRCLLTVSSNPRGGWNLRNNIAHGFVNDVHAPVAAVLIHCALYLWSITLSYSSNSEATPNV